MRAITILTNTDQLLVASQILEPLLWPLCMLSGMALLSRVKAIRNRSLSDEIGVPLCLLGLVFMHTLSNGDTYRLALDKRTNRIGFRSTNGENFTTLNRFSRPTAKQLTC